jgi:hypothetical protein
MSSKKARQNKKEQAKDKTLAYKVLKASQIEQPVTPEKQAYLDRCEKRKKVLEKLAKRRPIEKVRTYAPPVKGEAPFAYMVERGPKKSEQENPTE